MEVLAARVRVVFVGTTVCAVVEYRRATEDAGLVEGGGRVVYWLEDG